MSSPTKSSRVNVHSKLSVVSSVPIHPSGQTFPLSPLDHAMGSHTLHLLFYYRLPYSVNPGSLDLDEIRPSLSQLLSLYPNVTGRLAADADGNWVVKWNDAGVRVLMAKVDATVDEWLSTADSEEEMELTAWDDSPVDDLSFWSPFRVQINEFRGGGVAIGLSCTHLLADPTCATLLFKAWTEVHRHQPIAHPPFIHPPALNSYRQPAQTPGPVSAPFYESKATHGQGSPPPPPSVGMATATFSFSHTVIEHHLSRVRADVPEATPFDLLAALFWARIAPLKAAREGQRHSLSICVDFRKLLRAQLPYGYFGNALHFSQLTLNREELESDDLGRVAELIHRHVSGVEEEEIWSDIDWLCSKKDDKGKFAPAFRMYGPELTCVNMENMIVAVSPGGVTPRPVMYMATFEEDLKPDHVSYRIGNVDGEGLIMVMPSPEEGVARRVTVTLPKEQMARLCEDQVIMKLKPKLMLSGRREDSHTHSA